MLPSLHLPIEVKRTPRVKISVWTRMTPWKQLTRIKLTMTSQQMLIVLQLSFPQGALHSRLVRLHAYLGRGHMSIVSFEYIASANKEESKRGLESTLVYSPQIDEQLKVLPKRYKI